MTFTRKIAFTPAYDHRGKSPNFGQHPMHLSFVLRADKGALVFDLNTGWYIERAQSTTGVYVWGLHAHRKISPELIYKIDLDEVKDDCGWLDHEPCIAEELGSSISPICDDLLTTFLAEGEEALWLKLETIYTERM